MLSQLTSHVLLNWYWVNLIEFVFFLPFEIWSSDVASEKLLFRLYQVDFVEQELLWGLEIIIKTIENLLIIFSWLCVGLLVPKTKDKLNFGVRQNLNVFIKLVISAKVKIVWKFMICYFPCQLIFYFRRQMIKSVLF